MPKCLIGLGSNLGDRESILETAVSSLTRYIDVTSVSSWYTYPAIGGPSRQDDFLNGVAVADASMSAAELAALLQKVEADAGRERVERWSSRTLDCDLLLYGMEQINTPTLQVPHPRMVTRRFVLQPADEVAGKMIHPQCGWSIEKLLHHLDTAPPYFAILGTDHDFAKALTIHVANASVTECQVLVAETFSGSKRRRPVEYAQRINELLKNADPSMPLISNFWFWEPWLYEAEVIPPDLKPKLSPKLIIVTDPLGSEFGQRFANLDPQLRMPTLFLSADTQDAIQDAVGAVLAMD